MSEYAFATELVPIDALDPEERNANHGDVGAIATAIAVDGWHGVVVAQKRKGLPPKIVAGEHRWRALAFLQAKGIDLPDGHRSYDDLLADPDLLVPPYGTVPAQVLTLEELRALRKMIADNRASALSSTDDGVLTEVMRELAEADALLGSLFDEDDLDVRLAELAAKSRNQASDDHVPPVPAKPSTRLGDLWVLGEHRLLCGDATDPASYEALMEGELAHLVWTDPPYGVNYVGKTKSAMTIINDDLGLGELEELLRSSLGLALEWTQPGGVWFVTAPGGPEFLAFATVLSKLRVWRQTLVWAKDQFVLGRSDYHHRHEPMIYGWESSATPAALPPAERDASYDEANGTIGFGWSPGAAHQPVPDRRQDTLWFVDRPTASVEHPTMKPVALVTRAVRNHTHAGAVILDPFAGSGTVLVVAEAEACRARCIELDPGYCDVIVARWETMTGQRATRTEVAAR